MGGGPVRRAGGPPNTDTSGPRSTPPTRERRWRRGPARLTTVGKPLDLLLHPESGKLYVGSDTVAGTTGASLAGVYAVDPAAGNVLSWVKTSPGSTGAPAQLPGKRLAGPLPGD
ncbi:hypothetical protein ACFUTV_10030 [Streptomyces sp. NPDC057298]|uniref:hypothetical protein n=1 Tax=Streptomyces sp. NPDC057298 TaxID=3346091 RepID=UPI003639A639